MGRWQLLPGERANYAFQNIFEEEDKNNKDIKRGYFDLHNKIEGELNF